MKERHPENRHNPKPREIGIKREFLELIRSGQKTLELRVGFPSFRKLEEGADITFISSGAEPVDARITATRVYTSLDDVTRSEDISKLAPGMNQQQINSAAKRLFKQDQIDDYGLLIIEFVIKKT